MAVKLLAHMPRPVGSYIACPPANTCGQLLCFRTWPDQWAVTLLAHLPRPVGSYIYCPPAKTCLQLHCLPSCLGLWAVILPVKLAQTCWQVHRLPTCRNLYAVTLPAHLPWPAKWWRSCRSLPLFRSRSSYKSWKRPQSDAYHRFWLMTEMIHIGINNY